jgi:hypothetical protein
LFGASKESQDAVIEEAEKNNTLRGDPRPLQIPQLQLTPPTPPPTGTKSPPPRKKTLSLLSPTNSEKKASEMAEKRKESRTKQLMHKRVKKPSEKDDSASSADVTDEEQNYLDMMQEFNVSLEAVDSILKNVDTIIRSSARAERNRLIQSFNDYNDATHAYLEAIDEDGGPLDTYNHAQEQYTADRDTFEDRYNTLNALLDTKKKTSTKEKHKKLLDKMAKKKEDDRNDLSRDISKCSTREVNDIVQSSYLKIVDIVSWIEDYSKHVLTPKFNLSDSQVNDLTNDIEAHMAIAKKKEKMLMDYAEKQDKNHCEIVAHVEILRESANATLSKILCIRDASEGVKAQTVRSENNVTPRQTFNQTRTLDQTFSGDSPSKSRVSGAVFRSDSIASTIVGPQGNGSLAQARQQGPITHQDQSHVPSFSNAQLISMGCSGNANGSLTVDQVRQHRDRDRTLRPGGHDLNQGILGAFSNPQGNLTTDDPYATNNTPLCLTDSVTKLLMANPTQETDWSDIFTGKKDLLFWNPLVLKVKEDLSIPNKFSGVDLSLWCEFKATVHANVNTKQYLNWSEKSNQLSKYLSKPALDHCDFTDRTRTGYIMNLYILEREYGGFKKQESALYMMLSTLPRMDNLKPETLHEPRMILRKIVKVVTQEGHTHSNAEDLFFDRAPWEPWARQSFQAFTLARGETGETADLFDTWAKSCMNFHAQRVTRTNLSNQNIPTTVLAVEATSTAATPTVGAACLNIVVDNDHYQSDEDDSVFNDYGDYACLATYAKTRPPPKCYDCGLDHTVRTCPKFATRTPEEKAKKGHEWGLCPKCCGGKHKSIACRTTKPCEVCGTLTDHHTILHGAFIKDTSKAGNNPVRQYPQQTQHQQHQNYQQYQHQFQPQQFQPQQHYQQQQRMTYRPNNPTTTLATYASPQTQPQVPQPQMTFAMPQMPMQTPQMPMLTPQPPQIDFESMKADLAKMVTNLFKEAKGSKPPDTNCCIDWLNKADCKDYVPEEWTMEATALTVTELARLHCVDKGKTEFKRYRSIKAIFRIAPAWFSADLTFTLTIKFNMLFDDASSASFITPGGAIEICFNGVPQTQTVRVLGKKVTLENYRGVVYIRSMDGKTTLKVPCSTGDIPETIVPPDIAALKARFASMQGINFHEFADRPGVDFLMGVDQWENFRSIKEHESGPGEPLVREGPFGNTCIFGGEWTQETSVLTTLVDRTFTKNKTEKGRYVQVEDITEEGRYVQAEKAFEDQELTKLVSNAWQVMYSGEEVMPDRLSLADTMAMNSIKSSMNKLEDGAWEAGTIWRTHEPNIECNKDIVERISQRIEETMKKKPEMYQMATDTILGWIKDGYVRTLPKEEANLNQGHYLTIFGVEKMSRETTKLRMVVNAAQKFKQASGQSKCLNDCMLAGPKLHVDLAKVAMRMRLNKIAFTMDIKAMFMRFRLKQEDRKYHRFFFKDQPHEFLRWPFGSKSAPFVALFLANHIAQVGGDKGVANLIAESLYVDDVCASRNDLEATKDLIKRTMKVFSESDLHMVKLACNDPRVTSDPDFENKLAKDARYHGVLGIVWDTILDLFRYPEYQVPKADKNITRKVMLKHVASVYDPWGGACPVMVVGHGLVQEGHVFRQTHGLHWDTIIAPHTMSTLVADWLKRWDKFAAQANLLHLLTFPRWIGGEDMPERSLHVFCDGSKLAYAACGYLRVARADEPLTLEGWTKDATSEELKAKAMEQIFNGVTKSNLLSARKRLCPIKARTMPQTELMGCLMAAWLAHDVAEALKVTKVFMWTDSMCVLSWIKKPAITREIFVAHRVSKIYDLTCNYSWNYVNTNDNPADMPTRGATVEEVNSSVKWKQGAWWLGLPESMWPKKEIPITEEDVYTAEDLEAVCQAILEEAEDGEVEILQDEGWGINSDSCNLSVNNPGQNHNTWRPKLGQRQAVQAMKDNAAKWCEELDVNRFSTWRRLVRAKVVVARYKKGGLYGTPEEPSAKRKDATSEDRKMKKFDIFGAACKLIGQAQAKSFRLDIDYFLKKVRWPKGSYLLTVNAYVDHLGVLRAQGRTDLQAGIPALVKHPIVLPGDYSHVGRLIIEAEHLRLGHNSGVSKLQMAVNVTYIMRAPRERANTVEKACVICQKLRRRPIPQIMGAPHDRQLQSIKPFTNVSLDFAGPYQITVKKPTHRAYILVATCMQIKAVHLEMTLDLTTDSVLQALSRLASCRGEIEMIHSDNGPSFVKTKKVIKMSQEEQDLCDDLGKLDWDKIAESSQSVGVKNWTFSAPRSPEGNGVAESMVKLAKTALKDTFRTTKLTYDEFRTAIKKAENRINSRALSYIPADHWEAIEVLTPNHMLINRLGSGFSPEAPLEDFKEYCKHWEMAKSLETKFCDMYSKLCIADLMSRPKWAEMRDNLKPGQVVLVTNDGTKRCNWRLGLVLQVKKDLSGVIRTVNVKIKNPGRRCSTMTRNVRQLIPLSVFNEGHDDVPMGEAEEEALIMAETTNRGGPCKLKDTRTPIKKTKAKQKTKQASPRLAQIKEVMVQTPGAVGSPGTRTRSKTLEERRDATSSIVLSVGPGANWSENWRKMSEIKEVKQAEVKLFNYEHEVTQEEPDTDSSET